MAGGRVPVLYDLPQPYIHIGIMAIHGTLLAQGEAKHLAKPLATTLTDDTPFHEYVYDQKWRKAAGGSIPCADHDMA